jgi:iron complex outermembrane recepter protein
MTYYFRSRLFGSTILAGVALIAVPAHGQSATSTAADKPAAASMVSEPDAEIVVTGSLISRPDLKLASPVAVVTEQEIKLQQPNAAEDLIRDLPAARPSVGPAVNNGTFGAAIADLRGLNNPAAVDPEFQSNRTLVLLDGNRVVPIGTAGLTDLNNIPLALLRRVDVVTGGASSTYGADAVAGVINFITKQDFEGLQADLQTRTTEHGDGSGFRGDLTLGANFAEDKGNVVFSVGYGKTNPVFQGDRDFGVFSRSSSSGAVQGSATAVPVVILANNGLLPGGSSGAQLDPATGTLVPLYSTYNFNPVNYFQTPLERYNIYAAGRYQVADGVEVYASALFNRNIVNSQVAPSASFLSGYAIPLSNPYLPAGVRNQLCLDSSISPADCAAAAVATGPSSPGYREVTYSLGRRFTEYGTRKTEFATDLFQIQGGLRGEIFHGWKWNVSGQYGESRSDRSQIGFGSFSKLQQALRASNTSACQDPSGGCVPFNIFGPEGSITRAMLNFIDITANLRTTSTLGVVKAGLSGDLFTLPWAGHGVALAIGAEYRRQSAKRDPDGYTVIPGEVLGAGAGVPKQSGQYSVKEAYAEVNAPLIEDRPFVESLTLEGGIRFSDYAIAGDTANPSKGFSTTTWKAGASWEPGGGLKLRAMYQIASRAPNINELFAPRNTLQNSLSADPCTGSAGQLLALCLATGARQGANTPPPSAGQINVTTAGNRNLAPERAQTITAGFVFVPRTFMRGLTMTVDYFDIKMTNVISTPSVSDVLNGCYSATFNPSLTPNNLYCTLILRNPNNGSLNGSPANTQGVYLQLTNAGRLRTKGVDFGISYRLPLTALGVSGDRSVTLGVNGSYLDTYRYQAFDISVVRECKGFYSVSCGNPRPEWRWNSRLTYEDSVFSGSLRWNHLSAVQVEPAPNGPATVFPDYRHIPGYDLFDLAMSVNVQRRLTLNLTVNNLFNKQPPVVGNTIGGTGFNSGNTFPTVYDALGRSFVVGASIRL